MCESIDFNKFHMLCKFSLCISEILITAELYRMKILLLIRKKIAWRTMDMLDDDWS